MMVVSESKLVNLIVLILTEYLSFSFTKSSAALNSVLVQSGFGNPKIPEEIAGIDTLSHLSSTALAKVALMQLYNNSTFFSLGIIFDQMGPTA